MEALSDTLVKEQLIKLLHDRYGIPLEYLDPGKWDVPLTSMEIGMTGVVFAQLFFEIEKIYCKRFEASRLKDYGFCTINKIVKAILST